MKRKCFLWSLWLLAISSFTINSHGQVFTNFTNEAKLLPNIIIPEAAQFGHAVAIDSNTVTIGAPGSSNFAGAVYVYTSNDTNWLLQARLSANDAISSNRFGFSVAMDSNTVVAGSPTTPEDSTNSGAAYVFQREGTNWTQQAKLLPSDAKADDRFGQAVAIESNTVVVTAMQNSGAGIQTGAAYIFVRNGTNWTEEAKLTASDPIDFDFFGVSAAINSNIVVIGRRDRDTTNAVRSEVYVFARTGTNWTEQQKLLPSDVTEGFGDAVAIHGDNLVVGADFDNESTNSSGAAYAYLHSGTNWLLEEKIKPKELVIEGQFGGALALSTNQLLIGAIGDDSNGPLTGAIYIFGRSVTGWEEEAKIVTTDGISGDAYGFSIALQGLKAVVGAPHILGTNTNTGAAYLLENPSNHLPPVPQFIGTNDVITTNEVGP